MTPRFTAARVAALAALLTLLLPAALARAGTYVVRTCSNGSLSGWSAIAPARASSTCRTGGGSMHARLDGAPEEGSGWRFAAPPDTELGEFSITRSYWRNGGVAFGTPLYWLRTTGSGPGYFSSAPNFSPVAVGEPADVEHAAGLTGQTGLEAAVLCGGGGSCRNPAATLDVYSAVLMLRDAFAPAIERVSGSLLSDGPLGGTRGLRYTATDRGGGVARAELSLDGIVMDGQLADVNEGACAPVQGEFADVVPCRLRATNTLTLDTRRVADGVHQLRLRVFDATADNHADWTTRIDVDNVPPPANVQAPEISGEAREGSALIASAGEWTGDRPAFGYRWQRLDGGWTEIPGATSTVYVAEADDVGHRLRVRVTAVDAEGSGVAYSAATVRVLPADLGGDDDGGDGGAPGTPGPPPPSPPGPPAPPPADTPPSRLTVEAWLGSGRRSSLTVAYGHTVAVRGSVHDANGAPARGVALSLLTAVDGRWLTAATAWTDRAGRFSVLAGPGPSRRLAVAAGTTRSGTLRLAVRAGVRLRTARQGPWTVLRGALRGGHVPPGGVLVTIQERRDDRWVARTTLVTDRRGRFSGRLATGPSPLRAAVAAQPGYPFAPGTSAGLP